MARNSTRSSNRGRASRNADFGVMEMARERPIAAAAAAAGAAAAGLFLWSKRAQISEQLSNLSDQIGQWSEGMRGGDEFAASDDTAGLTTNSRSSSSTRNRRGMSETGSGNASLGRRSGGGGTATSSSGRRRVQTAPTNPQ